MHVIHTIRHRPPSRRVVLTRSRAALVLIGLLVPQLGAQAPANDRLRALPGFDDVTKMQAALRAGPTVVSGALNATWADDGRTFTYAFGGRLHRFDVATRTTADDSGAPPGASRGGIARAPVLGRGPGPCPPQAVARGRQSPCEASPDGTKKAYVRDRNLYVSDGDGSSEVAITSDGTDANRVKYGVASWVYGEELDQTTAIWWSPDSRQLAFYRFDESGVQDYYLQLGQTGIQDSLDVEAYPKAGTSNPVADVLVYDLASKKTATLDVRDGRPLTDAVVGHYVYGVRWAPDSRELRLNRMDRRQQVLELIGCSPTTTKCRVVIHEEWKTGWLDYQPVCRPIGDGTRFIWQSERNGWTNYYLYDFTGRLINPITASTKYDAGTIVAVDERAGALFYYARDGENHLKLQLHRVGLDGRGDTRLTDPHFLHAVNLAPDFRHFVDVYQTHDEPPATRLVDTTGRVVEELAKSDTTRFDQIGLKRVEMFTYMAADGQTPLLGTIAFPSTFDPAKKYPALVPVYGGPAWSLSIPLSDLPTESFTQPSLTTEYGFLVVTLSSRAAPGMGKRTLDSIYLKLGQTEMDDMAEGIRALWARPYFDKARVGIYGTSYGGYAAAMQILRHPDVFTAASASSAPTDWRHYDTIYTERYMWTPQENADGYAKGSAMSYANNLRGRLLIYYGTADNNVHPNNSMQLIDALVRAGKSFEVQVGPDREHSSVNAGRMMEFFVENLIARPERLIAPGQ